MRTVCDRTHSNHATRCEDFGLVDEKGRAVGVLIVTENVSYAARPAGETCGWLAEPGDYLTARVQPSRNGEWFGASIKRGQFKTEAERDAWIAGRVEGARKRYAKKYAA